MEKTYCLDLHDPNLGKIQKLYDLFGSFHKALKVVGTFEKEDILKGNDLPRYVALPHKQKVAGLSARQMHSVGNMVHDNFVSWLVRLENAVRKIIACSTFPQERKTTLWRLNVRHAWWHKDAQLPWREENGKRVPCKAGAKGSLVEPVSKEDLFLLRRIAKHALKKNPFPDLSHVQTIRLDKTIGRIEKPKKTVSPDIAWWAIISSMTNRHPVKVPIACNPYFEHAYAQATKNGGKLCGIMQLSCKKGYLTLSPVLSTPDASERHNGKVLGMDYGASDALMADSDGNLMGHAMLDKIKRLDERMTAIAATMQRAGYKPTDDPEYEYLVHKARSYTENEVGRILNAIANRKGAKRVRIFVVEHLDFRFGGMSPRMNRLITKVGRGCFKKRFQAMQAKAGIQICEVAAQYTSVQCSGCGFVYHLNRKSRSSFRCLFCGKRIHADVGAARTIKQRRSLHFKDGSSVFNRHNTFRQLDDMFQNRWNVSPAQVRSRALQESRAAAA